LTPAAITILVHATQPPDAVHDDLHVANFLADDLERYQERENDDRRAVLIVVEDRDVEFLFQALLDLKTGS
jgi:hypothetical protein